jgi:hypothetical protein
MAATHLADHKKVLGPALFFLRSLSEGSSRYDRRR